MHYDYVEYAVGAWLGKELTSGQKVSQSTRLKKLYQERGILDAKGKVIKYGNNVDTDVIIPARYLNTTDNKELADHCMEDIDKSFVTKVKPGDIMVAGENFGCGSSREQAASCLKGFELAVIAKGFSRIFLQNAINLGLNVIICPAIEANEGDEIEIKDNKVFNKTAGKSFDVVALPKARQAIIDAGGLIAYTRKKMLEKAK